METLEIQVTNQKAMGLLLELEALNFIKVLKKNGVPKQKLSEKYAGKLPAEVAEELQNYVSESRNQWNNRNI